MKLDSKFTCPDCKAQYQIEGKFKKHLADVHGNGKKDSICTYCEKVLSSTRALEGHLKTEKCNDCKAEFDSITEANDHMKTHTTCGICKYDFKSKSNLKRHMKDFHEQIVWFDFMSALYCLLVCFIASTILSASYALLPLVLSLPVMLYCLYYFVRQLCFIANNMSALDCLLGWISLLNCLYNVRQSCFIANIMSVLYCYLVYHDLLPLYFAFDWQNLRDKINARKYARSFIYWIKHSRATIVDYG